MARTNIFSWGEPIPYEVNDTGEIDFTARRAFTCGQCHAFAFALHERTNWPIFGLNDVLSIDSPMHCVVKTPAGSYLDIDGPGAKKRSEDNWGRMTVVPLDAKKVLRLPNYLKPDVDVARPFVATLLSQLTKSGRWKSRQPV